MKIGIEVQRLFRRKKHGMEIVALEIIRQLQNIDKTNDFIVFVKKDIDSDCLHESDNFKIEQTTPKAYPIWEQIILPKLAAKNNVDILHCTSNTAPLFCKTPLVITIHDIIFLEKIEFSGSSYQTIGNLYRRFIVPRVAKNAKFIITVSEYARQLLVQRLKIPENKIRVIHNGVSEVYKKISPEDKIIAFRKTYNLPEKFLLHFSNTAPRKNTLGTLKAFVSFCNSCENPIPLVITNCSNDYLLKLLGQINSLDYKKHIICLDYTPANELPYLYNAATIFIYPSFSEGFGMPVIEAMACGTPVITSNTTSLPEVSGDAAILIDPYNYIEIGNKIIELLNNKILYKEKQELGFTNSEQFSWRNAAQKTLSVYTELMNRV
ncbi:MAG TPA: glycosyltransferase family 1 protein [Ferruginibacter sp.]|nr:glycosyltransferase family 1 protein [Ferruginibacter sp.]